MINGIVLNHHSLPFCSIKEAKNGLLVFLKIIQTCRKAGLKILLVDEDQDKSLMHLELAEGYFVRNWYESAKKQSKLKDWSTFLRSVETRQPLFETIDLNHIDEAIEVGLIGEKEGKRILLAAYYFQTFLVSFATLHIWQKHRLKVWVYKLSDVPEETNTEILNLYNNNSLAIHSEELNKRSKELYKSASDIWYNRKVLFPNLILLSDQIGSSLQNWSHRRDILEKARVALNVLEEFCTKWQDKEYTNYHHEYLRDLGFTAEVSCESTSVKASPQKRKKRLFWLDDGRQVYCENHVKLPEGFRLHFYPDPIKKRIYVAYLGPHLPL